MNQFDDFGAVWIYPEIGRHYFDAVNGETLDSDGNQPANEKPALSDGIGEMEEIENPLQSFGIVAMGMGLEGGRHQADLPRRGLR